MSIKKYRRPETTQLYSFKTQLFFKLKPQNSDNTPTTFRQISDGRHFDDGNGSPESRWSILVEFSYCALISKRKTIKGYDSHAKSSGIPGKVSFKMSLLVH